MITFSWPWLFALLPLPFLLRSVLPEAGSGNDAALRVPYLDDFERGQSRPVQRTLRRWPLLVYLFLWSCLLAAAAKPQWIGEPVELPVSGRDLMLAIDLSGSMDHSFTHSFRKVTKLYATKAVAGDFMDKRVGDRIGLILFGEQAYVQAPLTFDRTTVKTLLFEAVTGLAGKSTAIGDAIGLAVKRLDGENSQDRVLILLTDGVSNAGELRPEKAAEIAAAKGLKIHTIGIGSRGSRELNELTLKTVAQKTGGQYFRAHDVAELQQIYALIDKLEPVERDTQSYRPTWSLFYWPLGMALLLAGLLALAALSRRRWR
ncbi:MAG: VWA domain-containing protein [Gammaproteobacteria bacterium]|jgi:Ca-activated chloride channel family protein